VKAYPPDLRERIVRAVAAGRPQLEVARAFGVGRATVQRYVQLERRTGSVARRPIPGRPAAIGPEGEAALRARLAAAPDATLREHCEHWEREQGVRMSVWAMRRAIGRLGLRRERRPSAPTSETP
jgi:transposase